MEAGGRRRDTSLRVEAGVLVSPVWRRPERRGCTHGGRGGGSGGGIEEDRSGVEGETEAVSCERIGSSYPYGPQTKIWESS